MYYPTLLNTAFIYSKLHKNLHTLKHLEFIKRAVFEEKINTQKSDTYMHVFDILFRFLEG